MPSETQGFRPQDQYLYVMQNEHGLIKVGRSIDPARRRLVLQSQCGCNIALVASLHQRGPDEEWVHSLLADFCVGYE
ncbi:hypothetical protein LMG28138_05424 [Pararobbsia alpina]|uniref:GIY-YIG nuclease family protein n=1 Tax=Pararobbsia alpina TaxID=621374 RepID=A0A6S7D1X9_9BURK|nr:hypothetical protein LMG28138_05424 [Pararobbsia alpina]